jgi:hypothetical protein
VTRLRHQVSATAPPRPWADAVLGEVAAAVARFRFAGGVLVDPALAGVEVRLEAGDHLAPGAHYRVVAEAAGDADAAADAAAEVVVAAWDPAGRSEVTVSQGPGVAEFRVDGLRVATVVGGFQGPGRFPRLRRARWHARVDLDRWWAGLPAAEVTAEHAWATATLRLTAFGAGDGGGRWLVRGQARARGRSWGRLVVAVALLVGRRALAEAFGRAMDDAARSWDEALDRWAGADPAEVARALLASAGGRIGDGDAPGGAQ